MPGAHHALICGSVTLSASSCAMMDAMPSASALLLGLDTNCAPYCAVHWLKQSAGLPMNANLPQAHAT